MTSQGWEKLQNAILKRWLETGHGNRLTRDAEAEMLGVSGVTLGKIKKGQGVDRSTLLLAFERLGVNWSERYIKSTHLESEQPHARSLSTTKRLVVTTLCFTCVLAFAIFVSSLISRQPDEAKPWFAQYLKHQRSGESAYHQADFVTAGRELDRALAIAKHYNDAAGMATTLRMQGEVAAAHGNLVESVSRYQEALTIRRLLQQRLACAAILEVLGDAEARLGRLDEAEQHYHAGIRSFRAEEKPGGVAACKRGLGGIAAQRGDVKAARQWYSSALIDLSNQPNPDMVYDIKARLAMLLCNERLYDLAEAELVNCLDYWRNRNHPRWIATTEYQLATVYQLQSRSAEAKRLLKVSSRTFTELGDHANASKCSNLLNLVTFVSSKSSPKSTR